MSRFHLLRLCLVLIGLLLGFENGILAEKPLVVASASMFADMTKQIGSDLIDVEMIVSIGGDPHLHEPTPRDAKLVSAADLILMNGLTFEGWINDLVNNSGTQAKVYTITNGVDVIKSELYANASDPHAWMNAENGLVYAKNIKEALVELLPGKSEQLNANYLEYTKRIASLDQYIKTEIKKIPKDQRILVTSHDAFAYYGKQYGIRLEALMGISTESEAQTKDMMRVIKAIRDFSVPAIFIESTINPKLVQQIAKDAGVKIGGELFADSLGEEGSEAGTYLGMLKYNTDVIVNALSGQSIQDTIIDEDQSAGHSIWVYLGLFALLGLIMVYFIKRLNT